MFLGERVESLKMVIDVIFVMFETDIRIVEAVNLKNDSNKDCNSVDDRRHFRDRNAKRNSQSFYN